MDEQRAQTAIDFLVGAGVFLLAMVFVLSFIPSLFAPFFGMGAADPLTADRSAAYLAENRLAADIDDPGRFDRADVDAFFADCDGGEDLAKSLGVATTNLNVTIEVPGETWACGDQPSGAETVSVRIVTVDGIQGTMEVVVW